MPTKKPAPLEEAVAYVALNDEPGELSASAMSGYASVHVLSVVYRLTTLGAARKVVAYRRSIKEAQ